MIVTPSGARRLEAGEVVLASWLRTRALGDRNALVEHYWYLCRRAAVRLRREALDLDDAEQVAALGLIKAAEYFREDAGVPFEAYAWRMVVGELLHHIRDATALVRPPRRLKVAQRRVARAREALRQRLMREPTLREVADELSMPACDVEAAERSRRAQRAEDLSGRRDISTAGLSTPDRVALGLALERLDDRERLLVLATFGAGRTQMELGEHLGCSQRHVSRLLGRALRKMARELS
ncbi:MAG TPA: sigma-70 family RNA polymerase sigma factor [Candidatus Dormibacteraeota bacterium]|nr:sigma-70 family RNA polymerase sigma factor [Candidatus Dormibacteraeota bacterium]